jgi:hypothetical protein
MFKLCSWPPLVGSSEAGVGLTNLYFNTYQPDWLPPFVSFLVVILDLSHDLVEQPDDSRENQAT